MVEVPGTELKLAPLRSRDVQEWVADMLGQRPEEVHSLCEVIVTKTNGNPLFVERFLMHLYEAGLLYVDSHTGVWSWDLETIQSLEEEATALARLNLRAGKRAMVETAYAVAREYFHTGSSLLTTPTALPDLSLQLCLGEAEAALMCGDFDATRELEDKMLALALDKATYIKVIQLRLKRLTFEGDHDAVMQVGLNTLSTLFGFQLPDTVAGWQELAAFEGAELARLLTTTTVEELANAPLVTNPKALLELKFLAEIIPVAATQIHISAAIIPRTARLSIQHGISGPSAIGYAAYSLMLTALQEYAQADAFGKLALALNKRLNLTILEAPLAHMYGAFACHWSHPIDEGFALVQRAIAAGLETGIFTNASWAAMNIPWFHGARGTALPQAYDDNEAMLQLAVSTFKSQDAIQNFLGVKHPMLRLMGREDERAKLESEGHTLDAIYQSQKHYPMALANIRTLVLQASYILGDYETALAEAAQTEPLIPQASGLICTSEFSFYYCLTLTALYPEATSAQQAEFAEALEKHRALLQLWHRHCPQNQAYKYYLVNAQWAALQGHESEAFALYEEAISVAQQHGFVHGEALALEHAGLYYIRQGDPRAARGYLIDAHHAYQRWGALAKAKQLCIT